MFSMKIFLLAVLAVALFAVKANACIADGADCVNDQDCCSRACYNESWMTRHFCGTTFG